MSSRVHARKLLVEGATERRVIPYLMEANGVAWETNGERVVHIATNNGAEQLLKKGVIESELAASGLETLGVVIDANGDAHRRWSQVRKRCRNEFEGLPDEIPEDGFEVKHRDGPRFGVWIMPDNRFCGMLEDLLIRLIPDELGPLYGLAQNCVAEAARNGASFKNVHKRKAEIHTWLAWQDEPGPQLHEAVKHRVLDPQKPESRPFVDWFRRLYRV